MFYHYYNHYVSRFYCTSCTTEGKRHLESSDIKILQLEEPTSIMCHGFMISLVTVSGATEPKYVIGM